MNYLTLFFALQLLDAGTTLLGLRIGAREGSPLIAFLMELTTPIAGLVLCKLIAALWAGVCMVRNKPFAIKMANVFFVGVVAWNVGSLIWITS